MAEITRKDLISDDALNAPLMLADNFEKVLDMINKIVAATKKNEDAISSNTGSTSKLTAETEKLKVVQTELEKVQKAYATSTQKLSDEYISNKRALNAVNEEVKNKLALGDKDAKAVNSQTASLKQLEAALKQNRDAYASLGSEAARTSKEGQELLKIIKSQDSASKELSGSMGQMQKNVGDYKGQLEKLVPGVGAVVDGFVGMTKAAWAFIATPIGAIVGALGLAIGSLVAYFKSSEEGQNRLNKIMLVGKSVMEQLKNFAEAFGEAIYNAFSNPQQAMKDFGNFLVNQIMVRFTGILELSGKIGEAFTLLFAGKFKEAGKVAVDAVSKVVLGVENMSQKVSDFAKEVVKAVDVGVTNGKKLADLEAAIAEGERKLVVDRAKTNLEVAKLREKAISEEGDVKRKTIEEAIELERKLSDAEVEHAKLKFALAKLELKNNGDDAEAKDKVAAAERDLLAAETSRYEATLKFQKQLEKLNDETKKDADKEAKDKAKKAEDDAKFTDQLFKEQADRDDKQFKDDKKLKDEKEAEEKRVADSKQKNQNNAFALAKQLAGKNKELAIGALLVEKAITIGQTIAATVAANAKAVAASPLTFGMPWVAINTASAAIGTAQTIASTAQAVADMPKFRRGTKSAPGGMAVVGEEGVELMREPGKGWTLTPPVATMMNIAKGTEILPHDKTLRALAMSSVANERAIVGENMALRGVFNLLGKKIEDSNGRVEKAVNRSTGKILQQGTLLYRVTKTNDGNAQRIRLKSMTE